MIYLPVYLQMCYLRQHLAEGRTVSTVMQFVELQQAAVYIILPNLRKEQRTCDPVSLLY